MAPRFLLPGTVTPRNPHAVAIRPVKRPPAMLRTGAFAAMVRYRPAFRVLAFPPEAVELSGLGFSLNPKKIVKRHLKIVKSAVKRHVAIVKKAHALHKAIQKRTIAHAKNPLGPIKHLKTGVLFRPKASPTAPGGIEYTDENGNPLRPEDLQFYTDEAGNPLAPPGSYAAAPPAPTFDDAGEPPSDPWAQSPDSFDPEYGGPPEDPSSLYDPTPYSPAAGTGYVDAQGNPIDPRLLMTLPAARIRELAEAGALYPGSGITARALLDRERSLYRSPVDQPPPPFEFVESPTWEPAPVRSVYGVEHTPTDYAALAPPYYGPESPTMPWASETAETAWWDQNAVYPAGPDERSNLGPSFADDAYGTDSLSGIYDVLIGDPIAFWRQKWTDAKQKLTAAALSISGTGGTLRAMRATLNTAIDSSSRGQSLSADDVAQLERLRQKLVALEANQAELESRARSAAQKVADTETENVDAGLGVFPIVAVGVVVAAVVGIVAAVVVHTQNVNALNAQIQAVVTGKITTDQIRQIQAGSPSLPGLPNLDALGKAASGAALLVGVGLVAYLMLGRRSS